MNQGISETMELVTMNSDTLFIDGVMGRKMYGRWEVEKCIEKIRVEYGTV